MAKESEIVTFFEDDVVMPNAPGKGVKFGSYSGALSAFGWRDITAPITVRGVQSTDPDWTRIGSTNFYAFAFAVGDFVWQPFHVPHDIVPGTQIHFHTHWIPSSTSTAAVTWQFDYMYAKGFNQAAFDPAYALSPLVNSGVVTATSAGPGVAYQHMVTETAAVTIPGLTEPDGIIYVRVARINNATSPIANNPNTIFLLTSDIHYQSTNLATKQKSPDFYAL